MRLPKTDRDRARGVLRSLLTAAEWHEYETEGTITFVGVRGTKFQLECNTRMENIIVDPDYYCSRICFGPFCESEYGMPAEDFFASQYLVLKHWPEYVADYV